jgi:hypothetical protein
MLKMHIIDIVQVINNTWAEKPYSTGRGVGGSAFLVINLAGICWLIGYHGTAHFFHYKLIVLLAVVLICKPKGQ